MKHTNILVLGGSGFIGSHVVAKLAAQGCKVVVPVRRRERASHLWMLPTVEVVQTNVLRDDATGNAMLAGLLTGMDAVINLVGVLHSDRAQPWGKVFGRAHVELPQRIAAAAVASGVRRIVHVSAIGAQASAPSMYLRSKAAGEAALLSGSSAAGLDVTVLRPSVVFGDGDKFLNLFAAMQKFLPLVPLAGSHARLQPVWVEDVAQAAVRVLDQRGSVGKVYELAGPRIYTLAQLMRFAGNASGHPRSVLALPPALGKLMAQIMELVPGAPLMSRDNLDSLSVPNIAGGVLPGFDAPEIGLIPATLEPIALRMLAPHVYDDTGERRSRAGR